MNEILVAIGGGLTGGKILEKLLGPTAEYLGQGMLTFAKQRVETIKRIFNKAEKKLGDRIESPGMVPPRVLAGILNEGSYRGGELEVEYFGGVLASARTRISRDDRSASNVALISRLSTYQLRSHYIFYRTIKRLFDGTNIPVSDPGARSSLLVVIPFSVYSTAMEFYEEEDIRSLFYHAMSGLAQEYLIEMQANLAGGLVPYFMRSESEGMTVVPSVRGVELFLAAYGFGHFGVDRFLSPECEIADFAGIPIPEGGRKGYQPWRPE
jgi:hypothetical protein